MWLHDIDIVRATTLREAPNHALFGSMHAGVGHIHDIRIENVTVEGPVFRLFRIGTMYRHGFIPAPGRAGGIGDITFTNVAVAEQPSQTNDFLVCQGARAGETCPNSFLGPIRFRNLTIAGRPIRSIDDLRANIDPRYRAAVTVE